MWEKTCRWLKSHIFVFILLNRWLMWRWFRTRNDRSSIFFFLFIIESMNLLRWKNGFMRRCSFMNCARWWWWWWASSSSIAWITSLNETIFKSLISDSNEILLGDEEDAETQQQQQQPRQWHATEKKYIEPSKMLFDVKCHFEVLVLVLIESLAR